MWTHNGQASTAPLSLPAFRSILTWGGGDGDDTGIVGTTSPTSDAAVGRMVVVLSPVGGFIEHKQKRICESKMKITVAYDHPDQM